MDHTLIELILAGLVALLTGGIGWLVKRVIEHGVRLAVVETNTKTHGDLMTKLEGWMQRIEDKVDELRRHP